MPVAALVLLGHLLGPRRLRAETAGVVFSTLILADLGELE